MQDDFKLYVSLLLAEPTRQRLGRDLLCLLFESVQSAYDASPASQSHGKAAIVVYATNSTVQIYEKWGYHTIPYLQDKANSDSLPCKIRFSPLHDMLSKFCEKNQSIPHMTNTIALLQFIPRLQGTINSVPRLKDQFKCLDKSNRNNLVGAFVHLAFTTSVKTQLSVDPALKVHINNEDVYKLKTPVFILGVVTNVLEKGSCNVLVCIDDAAVQANFDYLSTFVTGNVKIGYVLCRLCSDAP